MGGRQRFLAAGGRGHQLQGQQFRIALQRTAIAATIVAHVAAANVAVVAAGGTAGNRGQRRRGMGQRQGEGQGQRRCHHVAHIARRGVLQNARRRH